MSKRSDFNLSFYKKLSPITGQPFSICKSNSENNSFSNLTFIERLEENELNYFIESISLAKNNQPYDPDFIFTDGTEGNIIEFNKPYFVIDGALTIHMDDLKELMQEWVQFINS